MILNTYKEKGPCYSSHSLLLQALDYIKITGPYTGALHEQDTQKVGEYINIVAKLKDNKLLDANSAEMQKLPEVTSFVSNVFERMAQKLEHKKSEENIVNSAQLTPK